MIENQRSPALKIVAFTRYKMGDGLEKKVYDLAAEVAEQIDAQEVIQINKEERVKAFLFFRKFGNTLYRKRGFIALYKRIILKLSGETLAPETIEKGASTTFCAERVDRAAARHRPSGRQSGVQVGVVMGGGNIWRGRFTDEMNPVTADQMGMLATIINALAVQDATLRQGVRATRVHRLRK